jgi:hypothetical protein
MSSATPGFVQMFAWAPDDPLRWRLLAGNNREAGRGMQSYGDAPRCRLAIEELQTSLDETEVTVRRASTNLWTWQLMMNGLPIAAAGREYDRMIRCEQAAEAFIRGLRVAPIHDAVIISNSRRWESRSVLESDQRVDRVIR